MPDARDRRHAMVDCQVAARGVRDQRVLNAMREVPREYFWFDHTEAVHAHSQMSQGGDADTFPFGF